MRALFRVWLWCAAVAALSCSRPAADAARQLHTSFPQHVKAVLGQGRPITTSADGFSARAVAGARLEVHWPRAGTEPTRVELDDGFGLEIIEEGRSGTGNLAEGELAVVYPTERGHSFWSLIEGGYEEWLRVALPASKRVGRWQLRGGAAVLHGSSVLITDGRGISRLQVTAPVAYGPGGRPVAVELRVEKGAIALYADAEPGTQLLVDPIWRVTGSMANARRYHASVALTNGKVLAIGGSANGNPLAACDLYDPSTASWSPTGSLIAARYFLAAVLLPNGKVLAAGGKDATASIATAELYDPVTGTWSATGNLLHIRERHTLTLLTNGKVLATGDVNVAGDTNAEVYDPATGTWAATVNNLSTARGEHAAVRLPNGKVLVAGGRNGPATVFTPSAELYDPATNSFTPTGSMATGRANFSLTMLADGTALAVGGQIDSAKTAVATAEIYNPATGLWSATSGNLPAVRAVHSATLLQNGKVLIAGGCNTGCAAVSNTELYDPVAKTFSAGSALPGGVRDSHTATMLPDGTVVIAGGFKNTAPQDMASAEIYDPSALAWSTVTAAPLARDRHTATLLPNGKVLIAAGNFGASIETNAYLYDPAGDSWALTGSLTNGRYWHTATLLNNGKVLVVGGRTSGSTTVGQAELYDPGAGTWATTGTLNTPRRSHAAVLLADGRVLIAGGGDGTTDAVQPEIYDPGTGLFTNTANALLQSRTDARGVLLANGKALLTPGYGATNKFAEIYDPATNLFSAAGITAGNHGEAAAVMLPDGRVLVAGGCCAAANNADVYNPTSNTWSATTAMPSALYISSSALLPNGRALVLGGYNGTTSVATAYVYEPITSSFTTLTSLSTARRFHTVTVLPTNKVLVVGGVTTSGSDTAVVERLDLGFGTVAGVLPTITSSLPTTNPGGVLTVTGTLFTGAGDGSSGNFQSSAANVPLLQLTRQDSNQVTYAAVTNWSATSLTATLPPTIQPGQHWARVIVNGVFSDAKPLLVSSVGPPAKLAITVQPSAVIAGNSIAPSVQVTVQDASGNTVPSSSATVSIAIGTNPGGGTLSGTSSVSAVNGVATFSTLSVDKVGAGYTLVASSSGLTSATSTGFNVTAGSANKLAISVQPANATAGLAIAPAVVVLVQDANGNTVTSSSAVVNVAIGSNPGGSTLSGTTSVAASAGAATFSNLSLNKSGVGYTLSASSTGLTGITSNTFNVSAGAANKLAVSVQPSNATAGLAIAPAVVVLVQDANGNTVTGSSATVTMAIGANPGGSSLGGTTSIAASAGAATFSTLSLNKSGVGYTLSAASAGLTGITTNTFNVSAAAASQLAITVQPSSAIAGAAIAPAIQVTVQDALGNTVLGSSAMIAMAIGTNPGGSTLSGTTSVAATAGVATFSNLSLNRVGVGYTLSASSTGLSAATSSAFNITVGAPAKLAFTVQPSTTPAGSSVAPAVQVTVQDASGNPVLSSAASISVALGANPGASTLSGATTLGAVSGVATFSNLSLNRAAAGYTLVASSTGLTSATSTSFTINPGAATQLAFTTQPTDTVAGAAVSPAVQVTVRDASGNTVTSSSASITIAIGSNPGASTLSGTVTAAASSGVASFANLSLNHIGAGYTLTATSAGLGSTSSATFTISAGAPAKLTFVTQPSNVVAGAVIAPAVQVAVQDANGNTISGSSATITMAIGLNPGGSVLSGTLAVAASSGVASFGTLTLDKAGTAYTLSATSPGLTSATSATFDVLAASASRLAFTVQPSAVIAGVAIAPSVQVTVQDALGNTVSGSSANITVAISNNVGGANLSGTLTVGAVSGVATFSTLSLNKAGAGYTLAANSPGCVGAVSSGFTVSAAAASALAFTVQPATTAAGAPIAPAVSVAVQDAFGNTVLSSAASITLAIGANPGGSTLSGTTTVAASSGVAMFSNLSLNRVAVGYTLTATSGSLAAATSVSFDITAASASKLAFTVQPSSVAAGASIAPAVQVTVQDGSGNTVTSSGASITIAISSNPGGSNLSGTLTVSAVAGVATFSTLSLDKAAAGYTLAATSGGLTSATSTNFNVSAGAAAKLAFVVQPSAVVAGAAIAPAMTVAVQDTFGNTVTGSSAGVTLTIANNPSSGTLSGTLIRSATAGIATFAGISIDKSGAGYTLSASSAGLTPATSAAFTVSVGAPAKLSFVTGPSNTAAQAAMTPAVRVAVVDANGNTVASSSATITLAFGANPGSGSLGGTTALAASSGIATFSTLSVDRVGQGYTLVASSAGLTSATSAAFDIGAGAAAKLVFSVQPGTTRGGAVMSPAIVVQVQDTGGNAVPSASANVSIALGVNPGGATVAGTTTVSASAGQATFNDLSVSKVGSGYTLVASSQGLTSATSAPFDIVAGPATALAFASAPRVVVAGACSPAVTVQAQDVDGNPATISTPLALTVSISSSTAVLFADSMCQSPLGPLSFFPGAPAASLYFRDTQLGSPVVTAQAAGLNAVTQTQSVVGGPAMVLEVSGFPPAVVAGEVGMLTVTARDGFGNRATSYVGALTFSSSDPQAVLPQGAMMAPADMGQVTLPAQLMTAGKESITAASANLMGTQSGIVVGPAEADRFAISGVSSPVFAYLPTDVTVAAFDRYGNAATTYVGTVRFSSSDAFAGLPAEHRFTAQESGVVTVNQALVFRTVGTQSVSASDLKNPAVTGTQSGIVVLGNTTPVITHDANLQAAVGAPYAYNGLKRVTVNGVPPMTFEACAGPPEFTVDALTGSVQWVPAAIGATSLCVRASNAFGADRYDFTVAVVSRNATPVTASFTVTPSSGAAPLLTVLDASASSGDPGALPLQFAWAFGDGSPISMAQPTPHTYHLPGGYLAKLSVSDAFGSTATAAQTVSVLGPDGRMPPTARIVATPPSGAESLDVDLSCDCQAGSAPIAAYVWDFGNGAGGTGATAQAHYGPGRYHVHLTVVDTQGLSSTDSAEIVVTRGGATPPGCIATADPVSGSVPFSTVWLGYGSAGSNAVAKQHWLFGSAGEEVDGAQVQRTYTEVGQVLGQFTVEARDGLTCTDSLYATALSASGNRGPRIVDGAQPSAQCGETYRYSAEGTAVGDGPFTWSLLDGPDGMTIDATTGELLWVPDRSQAGANAVRLQVSSAAGQNVRTFEVHVTCGNVAGLTVGCGCTSGWGVSWVSLLWLLLVGRVRRKPSSPTASF